MKTATLVPVEEYLNTAYEDGDREYVDGRVVELNVGEVDHGHLQARLTIYLGSRYAKVVWIGIAVRVQVKPTRFRIPDIVMVAGGRPEGRMVVSPPLCVVEILSPDDAAEDLLQKISDYLAFGIRYVWVVSPRTRRAFIHTAEGVREVTDGILRTSDPDIEVPLLEMFA